MRYAAIALLLTACSAASAEGGLYVHDGDTFTVDEQAWRLWGIDAPELDQQCDFNGQDIPCGVLSRNVLRGIIGYGEVHCEQHGTSYSRKVGLCDIDGHDLSLEMVWRGWAVDWPQYSSGMYAPEMADARENKRGIWATKFQEPWTWRRIHRK